MTTGKHIIFLGAGASATSGYPLANELRLRISSERKLEENIPLELIRPGIQPKEIQAKLFLENTKDSRKLFRRGGFGSLDEFCKLMNEDDQSHVKQMRSLTRLALALHNPEDKFENSDYYAFVQRLFKPDALGLFRTDIRVFSYNYDVYLDYLLTRAVEARALDRRTKNDELFDTTTSGFWSFCKTPDKNLNSFTEKQSAFLHLKLHGAAYPNPCSELPDLESMFGLLFENEGSLSRLSKLMTPDSLSKPPPIIFPWEVLDLTSGSHPELHNPAHKLVKAIWSRACNEFTDVAKVSFVGTSLHNYLHDGLARIFRSRSGLEKRPPAFVIVNKSEPDTLASLSNCSGISTACGVHRTIQRYEKMFSVRVPDIKVVKTSPRPGEIRIMKTFEEFIAEEMVPFQLGE